MVIVARRVCKHCCMKIVKSMVILKILKMCVPKSKGEETQKVYFRVAGVRVVGLLPLPEIPVVVGFPTGCTVLHSGVVFGTMSD